MKNSTNPEKYTYNFKNNSFNFVRLIAALAVMIGHFFDYIPIILEKCGNSMPAFTINTVHFMEQSLSLIRGVPIFFGISTFLLCASLDKNPRKKQFLLRRFKRIFPELWIVTIFNAFLVFAILGTPVFSKLLIWIAFQSVGIAITPSIFDQFATGSLNGALWTIMVLMQSYVVLLFIYKYLKKLKAFGWFVLLSTLALINISFVHFDGTLANLLSRTVVPYALWFAVGAFTYSNRNKMIPALIKYFWVYSCAYVVYRLMHLPVPGYYVDIITGIAMPLIAIGFAYKFKNIKIRSDLSYEMYIVHWPVLNLLIYYDVCSFISLLPCLLLYIVTVFLLIFLLRYINSLINKK